MKIKGLFKKQMYFFLLLTIVFVSCKNSHSEERKSRIITINETSAENEFEKDDLLNILELHVTVDNNLAIGWGLTYNCLVVSVLEGKMPEIDQGLIIYISVGSKYYSYEEPILHVNNEYIITFYRTVKSNKAYIPAGTTGFMDSNNNIWLIRSIIKKEE